MPPEIKGQAHGVAVPSVPLPHFLLHLQAKEVVVEQVIVGVLLCVPLLGLLPTTLMWTLVVVVAQVRGVGEGKGSEGKWTDWGCLW